MKKFQASFLAFFSLPLALTLACGQLPQTTDSENNPADNAGNTSNNAPGNPTSTDTQPAPTGSTNPGTTLNPTPTPQIPAPARNFVIRKAQGPQVADIQQAVDQFRLDLGGANNLGAVGTQQQGHREINWDAVPADKSAPNLFPGDFFKARGAIFQSPCNQLQVSAKAAESNEVLFSNVNPAFSKLFKAFSPEKLFTALGSRVIEVTFTVPGSDVPATVKGFGSVFTDVDVERQTRMEFFDLSGSKILTVAAPAVAHADQSQSFVGVKFTDGTEISKVRIIMGNVALNDFVSEQHGKDAVAADDFLYAEPQAMLGRL